MATADKLNKILETKQAIKQAIIDKGVEVGDDTIFADYPAKIDAIESGGNDEFLAMRTDNYANMSYLFYYYQGTELDLSSFDTSYVRDMDSMFSGCYNLTELDLSHFNTNNATNMNSIFAGCMNLEKLNLSNFTATTTEYGMDGMLMDCNKLQELRLNNCDSETISKIINSYGFPTNTISDVTRKIYIDPNNRGDLTPPTNWIFVDKDTGEEIVIE